VSKSRWNALCFVAAARVLLEQRFVCGKQNEKRNFLRHFSKLVEKKLGLFLEGETVTGAESLVFQHHLETKRPKLCNGNVKSLPDRKKRKKVKTVLIL
jgi:hypothetical protein